MKRHLKRLAAPKTWDIQRKGIKLITRPSSGPHALQLSMPLVVFFKAMDIAKTTKEIKKLLNNNEILVDGRRVKSHRLGLGFMDIITIKEMKKNYRIVFNARKRLSFVEIEEKEAGIKPSKITGKKIVKKDRVQISLSGSRTIVVDKKDKDKYKVGDTLMIEVPSQKIKENIKLEKGAAICLTGGKHIGDIGIVQEVKGRAIFYKNKKGEDLETLRKYAFVVGKEKPDITIEAQEKEK